MDRAGDGERNAAAEAAEAAEADDLTHPEPAPAWRTYEPPQSGTSGEAMPTTQVTYGPPQDQSVAAQVAAMHGTSAPGASRALILVPIIFFLVLAVGVGAVILSVIGNATDSTDETFEGFDPFDPFDGFSQVPAPGPGVPPDLLTPRGFGGLLAALRAETGGSAVFEAVLYEEYAVTTAPAEPDGRRAISYYFDGELSESTKTTSTYDRFDLSTIAPLVLARLTRKARMLIEDPTTSYVIVRKPQDGSTTWVSAYASHEFGETGYLRAEKDGTVVDRFVS